MAGAAFISSNVYPYEHSIKNGVTGFVCGSKRQWKNALRKLITDEHFRKEMVLNARYEVMNKYNIENGAKTIHDFFENI
jgi:glycosyltransferase involved in cell wall biosynthesis